MNIRCPRCKSMTIYSEENKSRPFCSERCRVMDTAAWADEEYTIPTSPDFSDFELNNLDS